MKKSILMFTIAALVYGCTSASKEGRSSEEQAEEIVTMAAKKPSAAEILNPNLATEEEISSLGLDKAGTEKLINGRPYLDPSAFLSTLKVAAGAEKFDEVKERIFLPMNLNTTTEEDFRMVPNVGSKMAHEFEEYRPYTSIKQFRREIGKYVSEEEVSAYENYVFVPVNLNTSSKEEILAIPGVGDKMLHEFEEYRPYESIEQFRKEIGKYVDDEELARLERYVTF